MIDTRNSTRCSFRKCFFPRYFYMPEVYRIHAEKRKQKETTKENVSLHQELHFSFFFLFSLLHLTMRTFSSSILIIVALSTVFLFETVDAVNKDTIIPEQYILYYKEDADRIATNQRLFFSSGIASSSESFRVVHELKKGIAVAGITDEQYQELIKDKAVEKVIPVSKIE